MRQLLLNYVMAAFSFAFGRDILWAESAKYLQFTRMFAALELNMYDRYF
jgi:hypothetical protein